MHYDTHVQGSKQCLHPIPTWRLTLWQMTFLSLNRRMSFLAKRWAPNSQRKHLPPLRHSLVHSPCQESLSSQASPPTMYLSFEIG